MRVSVVIPCYNHARFVGEAIESALAQSWPDVEVLVVNDGSTDDSASVIGRLAAAHPGVRALTQANRGLSSARNAGLHAARGRVLIFLDADDRLWPGAARAACESLAQHPDAMLTFGRCRLIDASGLPLLTRLPVVERDFYEELLRRNYIWTPAMAAFRREVFDIVGNFDRRVNPSADYDMYLRIARMLPIAAHEAMAADYRQHAANMSRDPVAMLDATLTVLNAQRRFVAGHARLEAAFRDGQRAWREFYGEHLVEAFRSALRGRRYALAARHARALLRLYPRGVEHHVVKKIGLTMRGGLAQRG